jgi:hypothetical protein
MRQHELDALRHEIFAEHYPDLESAPVVKACKNCLFRDMAECVWHDRLIDERPWVLLCGGVHWTGKPQHMILREEAGETVKPAELQALAEYFEEKEKAAKTTAFSEV